MQACLHPRPVSLNSMPASSLPSAAISTNSLIAPWRIHGITHPFTSFSANQLVHPRSLRTSLASLQQEDIPSTTSAAAAATTTGATTTAPAAAISSPSLLPSPGHIELVIGPMFAGKSSELLRRVSYYESQGLTVALVKSNKDDRYSESHVVTHDGTRKECHAVPSLTVFRETLTRLYTDADVIAIDEAQFFPDLKEFCTWAADVDEKRLVLAGLDGDFLRRKFGQVLDLVPLADKVTKLTAICRFCQQEEEQGGNSNESANSIGNGGAHKSVDESSTYPAVFSLRISSESGNAQEVVGGADTYAPVCRKHYVQFSKLEKN
jgi:thymidine kinase